MEIEKIAKICHDANRSYCMTIGDFTQKKWENAPDWQKQSAINGVKFCIENPDSTPADSHNSWLKEKEADGWKYGEVKDSEKKEHPCFVPYEQLPESQKIKDSLFLAIVRALNPVFAETKQHGKPQPAAANFQFTAIIDGKIQRPVIAAASEPEAIEIFRKKYPHETIHGVEKI